MSPSARIVILGTLLGASCAPQAHAPVPVAQSADLVARPLVLPPAEPPCAGETPPYEVEAYIRWADGTPAEGIPFGFDADNTGTWAEVGRTGPDGRVTVTLDHVGRIGVIGYRGDHPARCARPPRETAKALEEISIARVCPVTVVARGVDGAPIAGTRIGWEARQGSETFRGEAESETDATGSVALPDLPCGEVAVHAWRAGLAQTRSDRQVPGELRAPCLVGDLENVRTCFVTGRPGASPETPTIGVELGPAVELHGRVRDTNGQPVVGARAALLLVGDTVTDADGRFDLWIPPSALREKRFLAVRSPEHSDVTVEVFGDGGTDGLTDAAAQAAPDENGGWATEITLEPTHQVTTHCAGFPGDRCDSLVLTCAIEGKKSLHECAEDDASRCECPASTSATVLSGGGLSVYVEPSATTAWLDFRSVNGAIHGRVASGGGCLVRADRPLELRNDPQRPPEARLASCGPDGEFLLDHLAPGTWELRIVKRGSSPGLPAAATVEVANERVEAGDIAVPPE